jgi:hypothetical protein
MSIINIRHGTCFSLGEKYYFNKDWTYSTIGYDLFLQANSSIGDAAGFKLSSLIKLTDTRANKPRMNLMHYVVMV